MRKFDSSRLTKHTKGFTLTKAKRTEGAFTLTKAKRTEGGFTLIELHIVIAILGILAAIGLISFTSSQAKSRDAKRKAHLSQIAQALELYYNDKGKYPNTDGSGNIRGCGTDAVNACTWGTSIFSNTTTGTIYMTKLPADPSSYRYYYVGTSSGTTYKLYTYLENDKDQAIINTEIVCGNVNCNYGISSANTTP